MSRVPLARRHVGATFDADARRCSTGPWLCPGYVVRGVIATTARSASLVIPHRLVANRRLERRVLRPRDLHCFHALPIHLLPPPLRRRRRRLPRSVTFAVVHRPSPWEEGSARSFSHHPFRVGTSVDAVVFALRCGLRLC